MGAEMAVSKLTSCYFMEVVLATGKLWVAEFRDLRGETKAYPTLLTPSLLKQRITASLLCARDRLRRSHEQVQLPLLLEIDARGRRQIRNLRNEKIVEDVRRSISAMGKTRTREKCQPLGQRGLGIALEIECQGNKIVCCFIVRQLLFS